MQTDYPTTHHPEHERQQIHDFFIKQNYTALYQTCSEIINDMLMISSREEFEDFLDCNNTLEEDIFWLHYAAARGESLLICGYDEDVTEKVTSFLQQKLPENIFNTIASNLHDLYVYLGTRDTLEEKIRLCNQSLSSSEYTLKLDYDETYCAGIYFLTIQSNRIYSKERSSNGLCVRRGKPMFFHGNRQHTVQL